MKKLLCVILSVLMLMPAVLLPAAAEKEKEVQYFEDGSYIEYGFGAEGDMEHTDDAESALGLIGRIIEFIKRLLSYFKSEKSVTETRYANYYDSKGVLLWSIFLEGSFTYNGKSSVCTKAKVSTAIYDRDWKVITAEESKEGNEARGEFVLKQYKLGVPLKEIQRVLTLGCDKDGNISL